MHVIVGAGPAGCAAIDAIREFGDTSPITLVSAEPAYSRMVLPYFMDDTIQEENVYTASPQYLDRMGVTPHFGRRVASLDATGILHLDDGTSLPFERALLATGSRATRPPIEGSDGNGVYNLWTLDDARAILSKKGGSVAVIGAGFIAFTCLDALIHIGADVTVIEVEPRILPRMVDEKGARFVQKWLEAKGVTFRTGASVTRISDEGARKSISFADGSHMSADIVIMATGIMPNIEYLEGSGLQIDRAVVVDDHLRSSSPNVFAAGDVAQGPVLGSTTREVHAIQPTALEHGRIAGANMAGGDFAYWGSLLMNIVDVQKLQIASFGRWDGDGLETREVVNEGRPVYRKLVFDGDQLVGAIFMGRPDDVAMLNDMGMVKGLIQTGVHLGEWRKYLDQNPLDIRRPYVAVGTAGELLKLKSVGKPSPKDGYRNPDPPPRYWDHHDVFVDTIPE